MLKSNTSLTELSLYNNKNIGEVGAIALAESLSFNSYLKTLTFGDNHDSCYSDTAVKAFEDSICLNNFTLTEFYYKKTSDKIEEKIENNKRNSFIFNSSVNVNEMRKNWNMTATSLLIDNLSSKEITKIFQFSLPNVRVMRFDNIASHFEFC